MSIETTETEEIIIEATASVYMDWDLGTQSWVVSDSCLNEVPLDIGGDGVYSDLGPRDSQTVAAQAEWDKAEYTHAPAGPELALMLLNGGIRPTTTEEIGQIITNILVQFELMQDHRAKLAADAARVA